MFVFAFNIHSFQKNNNRPCLYFTTYNFLPNGFLNNENNFFWFFYIFHRFSTKFPSTILKISTLCSAKVLSQEVWSLLALFCKVESKLYLLQTLQSWNQCGQLFWKVFLYITLIIHKHPRPHWVQGCLKTTHFESKANCAKLGSSLNTVSIKTGHGRKLWWLHFGGIGGRRPPLNFKLIVS